MLQARRDQLQSPPGSGGGTSTRITGYAPSEFSEGTNVLGYADQPQKTNSLDSLILKAPQTQIPGSPVWGIWVQGLGSLEHDDPVTAADIGHFIATSSVQGGLDRTWRGLAASGDAFVLGILGSWMGSQVSYDGSATTTQLAGLGVGLYSMYVRGGFQLI